ncbi:MAG TPA: translocation/assembly module TamB domain-containing protein [Vicinamibacterales bacterium]|nr:translocation/assembly module TamB domain-containing protein [Vicinamibacterales bacterium]
MRVLAISAIVVVTLIVAAVLLVHTNPVQSRLLGWSITELEKRFDLNLSADDLSYNLAARKVVMTNVRLAAVGHQDNPFFAAQTVTVQLPWAAYRGMLRFDEVHIAGGLVTITRDASGKSNLPPGRGQRDPNAPPRKVDLRALFVNSLDFVYRDIQRDIEIQAPGIRTDMPYAFGEGASGPFVIDKGVLIRVRQRRVTIEPVKGRVVFDGTNLELVDVVLNTSEGDFRTTGEITRALDQPTLNLKWTGTADIARAAQWTTPPVRVAGSASIEGTMTGAPSAFVFDSRIVARDAEVGNERGVGIDAHSRFTPNGINVSKSTITPSTGGEIRATVDAPFGAQLPWWIEADYQGIDAATAFRLAETKPLPFGAAFAGNARIDRQPGQPFRLELHNVSTPRFARGTAPLAGDVEFFIEGNRWRANQRHRMGVTQVDGRIGGVWNRQSATRSTFEGTLAVRTGNVAEAARYAAMFGLPAPQIVNDSRGPLEANVRISGIFTEPRFIGSAKSSGVEIPSVGLTAFTADFDASARAFNATNIDATVGSSRVRGEVFSNLVTRRLDGTLSLETPSVADLLGTLPETLRLEGPLTGTATVGGTVDVPEIAADIVGSGLRLGGQPVDSLVAKARIVGDAVNIESLTLRQGSGELRATGRYAWDTRSFTVDVTGQGLTWRGTLGRIGEAQATFALKFNGGGSIDRPVGEGVIEFDLSGGPAGDLIDRGVANVRLNGETALVTGQIPSLGAFITANIEPRSPFNYDAVVVMNRIDLAPVLTVTGFKRGDITGTASLSATAKGALLNAAASQVFINLQEIDAAIDGVPLKLASPSRLAWDSTGLTIDVLDLTVGKGRLLARGRLGDGGINTARWESTFIGELGELLKIGRPFGVPAELEGFGPVNIAWQSTGGLDRSTATIQLANGSVAWGTLPPVRDLVLDATFNGTTLEVSRFKGLWQDGGVEGSASIPRAVLEARETGGPVLSGAQAGFAKLRVIGLSEAALAPWLSVATLTSIDGRVSATLDARITRASLEGITGTLTLDEAAFVLSGVNVTQLRPSVLDIDGGLLTMRDVAFDAGGSPLTLSGTARLTPTDKQTLDLAVRGTADLKLLSAFAPTIATDGEARINIGIGGALSAPLFNGRIDIVDAEVALREPRIIVSDLNGTIALDGRRVLFDSLMGSANGGALILDGGFLLKGFTPTAGGLTIQIQSAAVEYPPGLQSEADVLVTLQPTATDWALTGDIRVARSAFTETISLAALIAARRASAPAMAGEEGWGERLRLNLDVSTTEDLRIDNNYGRIEAGAALRVRGTVGDPALDGRITLREGGEVYLAGNTFYITRGSISFTNPNRIAPEFDIELRTLVSGNDIALTLDGPLDRLETEVRSSDPNVDSREAMTMLFGGFRGEDAVTLLSAELLGATGRKIGLDTFRVQRGFETEEFRADPGLIANETDPSTRLTLSKRLRSDVELILSQSLRESGGLSAIVSYKPRRNVEIRAVSRDNLDRSVALRHEITFGGADAAAVAAANAQPEVAEVTMSGEPGRPTSELLGIVKLDPGDDFAFHEWQKDIDRLREDYHDRGFYEVRVRGTRDVSENGETVDLDYRIEPGPLAELIIEGHPLEKDLEEDLREAWMRTTFDRFLLEDIRTRITRHLTDENEIGAVVDAVVALSTPERKQIRVTVTPGTLVTKRVYRYAGNHTYDGGALDQVIEDAGLDLDGWLDQRRIEQALQDFYRSEGFLAVTVKADAPGIVAGAGVLPITIDEGQRFVIGSLTFPGVSPNRLADVAAAVNLDSGVPFMTASLDDARRRVEDIYAREGFNTVQIEVDSVPNADTGSVSVTFAILEGLQQVLREVRTQGESHTRPGVINRALRLRVGEPVNLADWSQARKRLYDTNVFRQVDLEPVPLEPTTEESAAGIQPVRAAVRVSEYPTWRFRYGAQFNNETSESGPDPDGDARLQNFGVLADLQNQNVFGRAITGGIAVRYERNRQAGSLFTSNSSFFGLPIRSNAFLFTSRQRFFFDDDLNNIDQRVGVSAEQRWRPFRFSEVIWSYRFERSHVFDPDATPQQDIIPLDTVVNVSRLNAAMVLDRRDDPSDPTTGWFTAANWEQAVRALGSDYSNGKMLVQHSMYRGLGNIVFAGRAQLGTSFGEQALIFSERFLLGGATTVRGYAENSLGPRIMGLPGGDALLALNGEVRFPVRGWVQGVTFVDAGNVFATRGELSFKDLAVGYGIGLRLASPFAMIRVDYGVPTRRGDAASENRRGRWYFGIGHIF